MNGNPLLYNISELAKDYYRFFEVGTGFFLRDGAQSAFVNNYDYKKYSKYFGARNDITSSGTHEGLESQGKVSSFPKETCIKQSFHQKQTIFFFCRKSIWQLVIVYGDCSEYVTSVRESRLQRWATCA